MKFAALETYLKEDIQTGNDSIEVLEKFLLYASYVQDPLNVFRYMEENAICDHRPLFWYAKSEYLAEMGDYRNAFICLRKTDECKEIQDNDERQFLLHSFRVKNLNTELKTKTYREQISQEMMRFPPNKRRTVSDFMIISNRFNDVTGTEEEKNTKMFDLLEEKFPRIRIDKEQIFQSRNQGKPKSWMYENYETLDKKDQQIIADSMIRNSKKRDQNNQEVNKSEVKIEPPESLNRIMNRSVSTPLKKKDPMRFSKTLDSVEILKRKRKTEDQTENIKKNYITSSGGVTEENDSDDENQEENSERFYNSVPVGRETSKQKKHVTFKVEKPKKLGIELPRNDPNEADEDDLMELTRRTGVNMKRGILRNMKSSEKKEKSQGLRGLDLADRESSGLNLDLKKTEQQDI